MKRSFYALIALVAVWAVFSAVKRYRAEAANDTVEICVDFNQCVDLCQANGYNLDERSF